MAGLRPGLLGARLLHAAGRLAWYTREVLGENDYEHYVVHHQRRHPGEPVMSRRDFERWKTDRLAANPNTRCC